jgi:hypothetical protein
MTQSNTLRKTRLPLSQVTISICFLLGGAAKTEDLDIRPVFQQRLNWCWVAVGEMVFEHHGIPNSNPAGDYQCGIIGVIFGPNHPCWGNCYKCDLPAGRVERVQSMLRDYPPIAGRLAIGQLIDGVESRLARRSISDSDIKREIDAGHPIICGINPGGFVFAGQSAHVALIIGYEQADSDEPIVLLINDPFPYDLPEFQGRANPYIAAGGRRIELAQYQISSDVLRNGLLWNTTIFEIRGGLDD